MARACAWVLVALITALSLPATRAGADPVAVIASVKGKVDVTPAGAKDSQHAVFGRALQNGDRVTVGPGGSASLFFGDGNMVELGEKSSMTVGGKDAGGAKAKASGVGGDVYASVTKFVTSGSRATGLVASSEMRGGPDTSTPIVLAPRRATVLTASPSFRWRAVKDATRYRVTVSSAGGELWNREWDADKLATADGVVTTPFPNDVAPLPPDTECLWKLEALTDLAMLREESSVFRTAAKGAREAVDANLSRLATSAGGADTPAARFLAGSYLSGLGLYHDAADQFAALARLTPESPAPHEALGNVYSKVGLMDLAAAEYQQALALGRAAP
jgi:hypothetical protein